MPFQGAQARVSFYDKDEARRLSQRFENNQNLPLVVQAIDTQYDQEKGIFTAKGCVIIRQAHVTIQCEKLVYHQKKDQLVIYNAQIRESSGDIIFCEKAELNNDLKTGVLENVRILTHKRERITARRLSTENKKQKSLMSSYTPCAFCQDTLQEPVWSLHGAKVEKDPQENVTKYEDVSLKFRGKTIAYLPHFYLPNKPRSGILSPQMGTNASIGYYLGVPYYIHFAKNKDLTLTPFYMARGGGMLDGLYRYRWSQGTLKARAVGNVTHAKKHALHQHLSDKCKGFGSVELDYHMTPRWRLSSNEYFASDRTFLSSRPFFGQANAPYLQSSTSIEGFYPHHFLRLRTLRYQDQSPKTLTQGSCIVAPEMRYTYKIMPSQHDHDANVQVSTVSFYRNHGTRIQRVTADLKWNWSAWTTWGQQFTTFAFLGNAGYYTQFRKDRRLNTTPGSFYRAYNLMDDAFEKQVQGKDISRYRFFPQAGLLTRLPFRLGLMVFSPVAQIISAPCRINSFKIPNEDSQCVDFNDTNIFCTTRYPGWDRVDDGTRVNYGLEADWKLPSLPYTLQLFLGQSYAFTSPSRNLGLVGVRKGASDIVGRALCHFSSYAHVLYRFRYKPKPFRPFLHEVGGGVGPKWLRISGSYIFFLLENQKKPDAHQLSLQVETNLWTNYWKVLAFVTQDLNTKMQSKDKKNRRRNTLDQGAGVSYEDECFSASLTAQYSRYRMLPDLKPGFSLNFSVSFKNLGTVGFKQRTFSRKEKSSDTDLMGYELQ